MRARRWARYHRRVASPYTTRTPWYCETLEEYAAFRARYELALLGLDSGGATWD